VGGGTLNNQVFVFGSSGYIGREIVNKLDDKLIKHLSKSLQISDGIIKLVR